MLKIQIEKVFNGFVITDFNFGINEDMERKIVIENRSQDRAGCCDLDQLKSEYSLLRNIVELMSLDMQTHDKKYHISLVIQDREGDFIHG